MGSIEQSEEVRGTFSFRVDKPLEEYDPWALTYGKAPPSIYQNLVSRTFPLRDFRDRVLGDGYSVERSREFLRENGFTVVKHSTSLHQTPYGDTSSFRDADVVNDVYYAEIEQLIKEVTGCKQVFVTDSVVRHSEAAMLKADTPWQKKTKTTEGESEDSTTKKSTTRIHMTTPTPPVRIPHWDYIPVGARQTIRNWSQEMTAHAEELGIIAREDEICAPKSATDAESSPIIDEHYDGSRYAAFTVWRPLKTITRDPLAMCPYRDIQKDPNLRAVSHQVKQPGSKGDWLRDLASVKVPEGDDGENAQSGQGGRWYYVSDQKIDEVLIVKAFDSAALPGQAKVTGEAAAGAHASPDIGESAHGEPRESIDVRVVAFW